ncbi:murein hydrolase activator EnvC [Sphingomonas sp. LHG3406-1]|uniref:murein hydrolase activator EnvC family protein n=1 Tax=Sphingomonas sp. LHG3406-1 TaxID=2804617 RepID=UPI00262C4013|nr:M23 family metallopeptidase [Sphingomonas sp. LHG3406-1]
MRRLLVLALSPMLLSAANPVALARQEADAAAAEQQRLERAAAAARGEAARAAADAAAAAQEVLAIDARIALAEAELVQVERQKQLLDARLAEARRPASALLAGLAEAGRRPAWLVLAGAGQAEEQVRLAALVRTLGPEVERRSEALRRQAELAGAVAGRQRALRQQLDRDRQASAAARQRFAEREKAALAAAAERGAEALAAGDAVLARGERLAGLTSEGEQRRAARNLAAALARLPAAEPRPVAPEGNSARRPIDWTVPVSGPVTAGLGELQGNGVRTRGLTIASARGTQVVAPADGKIAFAGPFRRREGVVIVDHGGGWRTLLTDVRPSVRVGDRVTRGQAIGRALGPITAELFQGGTAEPAALLSRS